MKIEVKNDEVYFIPYSDVDLFNIGALKEKLKKSETSFSPSSDNASVSKIKYLKVEKDVLLDFIFTAQPERKMSGLEYAHNF